MMIVRRNSRYRFALILLVLLLVMNAVFFLMDRLYPRFPFDAYLFRVACFMILLCIMVLLENLMVIFLKRYTLLGAIFLAVSATAVMVTPEAKTAVVKALSPFLANKYMRLKSVDIVMLFLLNTVLVSIMVVIMLNEKTDEK